MDKTDFPADECAKLPVNAKSAVVRGLRKVQMLLAAKDQKAMQAVKTNVQAGGASVAIPQQLQ